ncbi:MAG: helix-turn-helix transcriptional regulator [Bacillota bacterium]|nr:helix-turn-helix transcriptional regulator [Bacillota bacterium]
MLQQLGKTIRAYRNKKGYTITQLANKLNISTGLLSNIETGKTDTFQLTLLNNMINGLEIPLSELNLFSNTYPIKQLNIDITKDFKKIDSSLERLINAFISTSSSFSYNRDEVALITDMLVNELQAITKLIEASKSI